MSLGRQSEQRTSFRSNGFCFADYSRPSVYGRMSIIPNNTIAKDPRPIREKSWQQNSIRMLISALVQMGYPNPVSPKTVSLYLTNKAYFTIS